MGRVADIPGLTKAPRKDDLNGSRKIYNALPDDSDQPEILPCHLHALAELFVRNHAHLIFGIHLVHAHFRIPENTFLLGMNYTEPRCRWAKASIVDSVDLDSVHGHVFVLTSLGFRPYEYQHGELPDLTQVSGTFFQELKNYLQLNKLDTLVGLQVIDPTPLQMFELVLPQGTIMLDISNLRGCRPSRQTGWKFEEVDDGKPRVCKSNETHARHANGHDIFNEGAPHPILETFQDVKQALEREHILCP